MLQFMPFMPFMQFMPFIQFIQCMQFMRDQPNGATMSTDAPWRLDETTLGDLIDRTTDPADAGFDVAVLPFGCTEPHNRHLPYGTDTIEAMEIGDRICHAAWRAGARVALLPAIPYGTTTNQFQLRFTLNLMPTTILSIVRDLLASLSQHGIRKVVLLNSHGGNDLKWMLRELHGKFDPDVKLFLIDWFRTMKDVASEIFEHPDDHAGEMETSILLATRPELVARDGDGRLTADEGATNPTRFEAIEKGWVSISRPWHLLTTNTGAGNPHRATAEKGERLLDAIEERYGRFLVELAESPLDENFPF
jgi:creatinine amidohydrolase